MHLRLILLLKLCAKESKAEICQTPITYGRYMEQTSLNLNSFPSCLLRYISSYLSEEDRARLSCVSRIWRRVNGALEENCGRWRNLHLPAAKRLSAEPMKILRRVPIKEKVEQILSFSRDSVITAEISLPNRMPLSLGIDAQAFCQHLCRVVEKKSPSELFFYGIEVLSAAGKGSRTPGIIPLKSFPTSSIIQTDHYAAIACGRELVIINKRSFSLGSSAGAIADTSLTVQIPTSQHVGSVISSVAVIERKEKIFLYYVLKGELFHLSWPFGQVLPSSEELEFKEDLEVRKRIGLSAQIASIKIEQSLLLAHLIDEKLYTVSLEESQLDSVLLAAVAQFYPFKGYIAVQRRIEKLIDGESNKGNFKISLEIYSTPLKLAQHPIIDATPINGKIVATAQYRHLLALCTIKNSVYVFDLRNSCKKHHNIVIPIGLSQGDGIVSMAFTKSASLLLMTKTNKQLLCIDPYLILPSQLALAKKEVCCPVINSAALTRQL